MHNAAITLLASALLAVIPTILGHANIVDPPAVWHQPFPSSSFGQTLDNLVLGPMDNKAFGYGGSGAIKYIVANLPKSKYKTLRDLILDKQVVLTQNQADAQCGLTVKDETKRATLPATLKFTSFFHPGPCEVWCDNTRLAYNDDCQTAYPGATIPVDKSKCAGADRLTWYWIAVHGSPWQVYIDCVYLKGGSSGPTTPIAPVPQPAPTPQPPTPAITPVSRGSDSTPEAATPGTRGSESTPEAPKKKCIRKNI